MLPWAWRRLLALVDLGAAGGGVTRGRGLAACFPLLERTALGSRSCLSVLVRTDLDLGGVVMRGRGLAASGLAAIDLPAPEVVGVLDRTRVAGALALVLLDGLEAVALALVVLLPAALEVCFLLDLATDTPTPFIVGPPADRIVRRYYATGNSPDLKDPHL
jgi:hypothetical protein